MEEWKTIEVNGEQLNYEVSTKGRIRNIKTGRFLSLVKDKDSYLTVSLYHKKAKSYRVNRLVATAFIPNPQNLTDVDHIDKDRSNNCVENLRWLSHENNMPKKPKKVKCVETGKIYESTSDVERKIGLNQGNISKACRGILKTCGGFHWEYVEE